MITTHILDTSLGRPAESVGVRLQKKDGSQWKDISHGKTNADGRFSFEGEKSPGTYQIIFEIENYFQGREFFFLNTPVVFKITDTQRKYHVPLLLNPFGYSTYRGS
jgi:5-hydroxyisourate hydrolase